MACHENFKELVYTIKEPTDCFVLLEVFDSFDINYSIPRINLDKLLLHPILRDGFFAEVEEEA